MISVYLFPMGVIGVCLLPVGVISLYLLPVGGVLGCTVGMASMCCYFLLVWLMCDVTSCEFCE